MDIVSEVVEKGVAERRFDLKVGEELVPGILWQPEPLPGPTPTILIGHGGTAHKRVPNVLGLARSFVRHLGYSAVAIDAPGHGDRITDQAAADQARRNLQGRIASGARGERQPMVRSAEEARAWVDRTTKGVGEWKAVVDELERNPRAHNGRFGYWGLSMGTAIGLPFVAAEPRIAAAVLGLAGLGNRPDDTFEQAARTLSMPILFVFQWDDELMTRESGIALFSAIGSKEKTMHISPGGHVNVPRFERKAAEDFFTRHLS